MAEQNISFSPVMLKATGPSFENLPTKENPPAPQGSVVNSTPTLLLLGEKVSETVRAYSLSGENEIVISAPAADLADEWQSGMSFGLHISSGSGKIAISAPYRDIKFYNESGVWVNTRYATGAVYLYDKNNLDGSFVTIRANEADQELSHYQHFGQCTQIVGDKIYVGAPGYNSNFGAIYTYNLDGTNETKFVSNSQVYFGQKFVVTDQYIFVGAPSHSSYKGAIYRYPLDWSNVEIIQPNVQITNGRFGQNFSVVGNKIYVAHQSSNTNHFYSFDLDGNNEQIITTAGSTALGYSAISATSNKVCVGSYKENTAYVFDLNPDGSVNPNNPLGISPSGVNTGDAFGLNVALDESVNKLYVSAGGDDTQASNGGAVYIFDLDGTLINKVNGTTVGGRIGQDIGNISFA
jgi:hypothetical protein